MRGTVSALPRGTLLHSTTGGIDAVSEGVTKLQSSGGGIGELSMVVGELSAPRAVL